LVNPRCPEQIGLSIAVDAQARRTSAAHVEDAIWISALHLILLDYTLHGEINPQLSEGFT